MLVRSLVFYHLDISKAEVRTLLVILEVVFEYAIDTHNNEKMKCDLIYVLNFRLKKKRVVDLLRKNHTILLCLELIWISVYQSRFIFRSESKEHLNKEKKWSEAILDTFEQTNYRKLQVIHYLKWNGAPSGKYVGAERFFRPIHGFPIENATWSELLVKKERGLRSV